ncbi:MAG TPA: IS200/IS605 family transposase [Saprospiraceae bacterium]|nr:IS200/IS605 family transposase [Saprospiraceae bacterium]
MPIEEAGQSTYSFQAPLGLQVGNKEVDKIPLPRRGKTDLVKSFSFRSHLHPLKTLPNDSMISNQNSNSMANTYTQIHIQIVTAVKYRQALISPAWKNRLHQYMTGIIQNHNHKLLAINSMPDHIHFLFGYRPHQALSDLIGIVKGESSEWINLHKLTPRQFRWQEGYGAFSYTKGMVGVVANYIEKQEEHHKKKTFLEEYQELLIEFGIDYDDRYVFKLPE